MFGYSQLVQFLTEFASSLGYWGIFFLMTLESSFFPFPSEVVLIPAGLAAKKGELSIVLIVLMSTLGSLLGAFVNYAIAFFWGRSVVRKIVGEKRFEQIEKFFADYGVSATFLGRLIPVVRQYISFPAGLSKMNLWLFSFATAAGAGIWSIILVFIGYLLPADLQKQTLTDLKLILLIVLVLVFLYFTFLFKRDYLKK